MPGSPTTVTSSASPEAVTRCSSSCSRASSPDRPTKAVGVILAASRRSPSTRHTSSGSVLPFTFAGGSAEVSKAPSTSRWVVSPITRPSRGASACILEVVLTTSPATASPTCGPSPKVTTASPVSTAMRTAMSGSSRRSSTIESRIRRAARTARIGSSSCASGAPNTPITASPMNLSSVPPKASRSSFTREWNGTSVRRTSSGSARSDRSVNPTRSTNRIVTTRRSSCGGAAASSRVPHARQKRAFDGFSVPHEGQTITGRV